MGICQASGAFAKEESPLAEKDIMMEACKHTWATNDPTDPNGAFLVTSYLLQGHLDTSILW